MWRCNSVLYRQILAGEKTKGDMYFILFYRLLCPSMKLPNKKESSPRSSSPLWSNWTKTCMDQIITLWKWGSFFNLLICFCLSILFFFHLIFYWMLLNILQSEVLNCSVHRLSGTGPPPPRRLMVSRWRDPVTWGFAAPSCLCSITR